MKNLSTLLAAMMIVAFAPAALADEAPAAPAAGAAAATAPADAAKPAGDATPAAQNGDAIPDSVAILTGSAEGGKRKSPFGVNVTLEQVLGIGTFVSDTYARNPYYGWSLALRPRYYFNAKLFAELTFILQGELTKSYQSSTTFKRQVMPSDLVLNLKYNNVATIPGIKVNFSPYIRLGAPTSYESRYRNLYLSTAAGFNLNRMFGSHVFLDYMFRFNKNWNKTAQPTVAGASIALARMKGNEDMGGGEVINGDDNNISFSVYNALTGSFIINDEWSLTLQLAIQNSWTYLSIPKDALSSDNAKAGRGQRDRTYGTIDLSYQPWQHFGFSLGLTSAQPAKTANNKSFRFPFFDFSSEGNNFTQVYFDVYANY
jgi:hypothetical protein